MKLLIAYLHVPYATQVSPSQWWGLLSFRTNIDDEVLEIVAALFARIFLVTRLQ